MKMPRLKNGRLGLLLAGVLGVMSVIAAPAFGSGPPTTVTAEVVGATQGITHTEVQGGANPNGLSTTVRIEYKEHEAGSYKTALSKEIGAGESVVGASTMLNGLRPKTNYDYRVSATNSAGTVYSKVVENNHTNWIVINKGVNYTVKDGSTGTATWEYHVSGLTVKTQCNEMGFGELNSVGGTGDGHTLHFYGCELFLNGKEECPVSEFDLALDATFTATELYRVSTPPFVCKGESTGSVLTYVEPFFVTLPFNNPYLVTQPLTITTKAIYNTSTPVTVTIKSDWRLTGKDEGRMFGAVAGY
jgi:hypothetical protein